MDPQRNAITRRLEKIRRLYGDFYDQPECSVCHWQIKMDEARMLEAFYTFEDSEHGVFPDIFIRLTSPFTQSTQDLSKLFLFQEQFKDLSEGNFSLKFSLQKTLNCQ